MTQVKYGLFTIPYDGKPTSSRCNLKCEYCFYLDKENSLKQSNAKSASDAMPYAILKRYIKD